VHGTDDVNREPNSIKNSSGTQGPTAAEQFQEAIKFFELLRSGGPWVLTGIVPDGEISTNTAPTANEIVAFLAEHNGLRNLYYSVNPTRKVVNKKAAKTDIAAIEYSLADLDPRDDETSEQAKVRYSDQLNGSFEPKPTFIIDSGNGIQCLWRLKEPIVLGEPLQSVENGKVVLRFARRPSPDR
jgi:hypothetical protein